MKFNNIITYSSLGSDFGIDFSFEVDSICPLCQMGSSPNLIQTYIPNFNYAYAMFECVVCKQCYLSKFAITTDITLKSYNEGNTPQSAIGFLSSTSPYSHKEKKFDEYIESLSLKFTEIYNQALQAENMGLDEIAGIAYRKSVEFLIKDYLISKHPDSKERIEKEPLKNCIDEFLENKKLKTLALASAWIGNDEAHYIRKHADKDTQSLKKYISAFVHFLEYELSFEEANELVNRPKPQR
ncbi:DUF4145 domain-containing protein [Erysipelothrix anatis]|uniref:DUF4145 domain-containing protein n=1 Tax=Erysipelothrix anatis TaxID=2683713 RepID=UPI0013570C27|nr:DUF4145 domain-containing protein [Erysipelothrix anatis]